MAKKKNLRNSRIKDTPKINMAGFFVKIKSLVSKRKIIVGAIIFVILFLIIRSSRGSAIKVETQKVSKNSLTESISASGEVTAEKLAYMYFPTGGKVAWLGVSEGDSVKKYQALASLDKTTLDATYQQAMNMVRKYGATVDYVHDTLKNKDKTETFSEKDTRTSAEAMNDYYYNALRVAEYNLKNANLIAPFDGIVTSFAQGLAVGANFLGTSPAFIVVDPSTTYLKTDVGESDVVKIVPNQKVVVELDAYPGETFDSTVKTVDFANFITSSGGKAYKVKVNLPENKDLKFKLGMSGDAKFILSEKESVLTVSQGAIVEEEDKTFVWVINNGRAEKKEVKLGSSSVDDVEIISGLNEGETIVINPPAGLKEGAKVKYASSY